MDGKPWRGNTGWAPTADLQRQVGDDLLVSQHGPFLSLLHNRTKAVVEMRDVEGQPARVGDVEGEHVEALASVVPVRRRKLLGSTKDNVERVWSRELTVEGVVGRVSRGGIHLIG